MKPSDITSSTSNLTARLKSAVREKWTDPKIRRFAAWGAAGCLVGALLGELLLSATRHASFGPPRYLSLLIDCSGSMMLDSVDGVVSGLTGAKMREVKAAATDFVGRQNLQNDKIAVIGFESAIHRVSSSSGDVTKLKNGIRTLEAHGGTSMHEGLDAAREELPADVEASRSILLFTDGMPDDPAAALRAAKNCREQKITIVAIATGDADVKYLQDITGDPSLVFPVTAGNFGEGFQQAEKAIFRGSLVESESSSGSWWKSLLVIAAWTALLACGTSLALIVGQNLYLKRHALSSQEALVGSLGGSAAGIVAGIAGQLVFLPLSFAGSDSIVGFIAGAFGRLLGWTILGALVGRGLAFFIPNLDRRRILQGGAFGGAVGALAFLIASLLGDVLGRLLGAAILGACIGMMIALVEAVERKFWLEIRFGAKESICVSLGATPVKIGGDSRACSVYARGARAIAVAYQLENDQVSCIDYATEKTTVVEPGSERVVGNLTAIVRSASRSGDATSAPPPPVMAAPRGANLPPPPSLAKKPVVEANAKPIDPPTPVATPTLAPPIPPKPSSPPKPSTPQSPEPQSSRPTAHPVGEVRTIRPIPPPPPPPKAKG